MFVSKTFIENQKVKTQLIVSYWIIKINQILIDLIVKVRNLLIIVTLL